MPLWLHDFHKAPQLYLWIIILYQHAIDLDSLLLIISVLLQLFPSRTRPLSAVDTTQNNDTKAERLAQVAPAPIVHNNSSPTKSI